VKIEFVHPTRGVKLPPATQHARWHSRFVDETPGIDVDESGLALAAAAALAGPLGELAVYILR
jgi:hypothetical protein